MKRNDERDLSAVEKKAALRARIPEGELHTLRGMAMGHRPESVDIDEIRAQVRAGEYKPDIELLAERILRQPGVVDQFIAH